MKIQLTEILKPQGQFWQVRMGHNAVSFRTEMEAKQFVSTLQRRLQAPHTLPARPNVAV
ncbi:MULTISPECIES: hypothetical protein [unclassified Pseudomonas]|uniref:hypothetical protein n=1 Tax=unclassified Pseudomonas TaxID=196821 RepID=UPI000BD7834D|nr:MULTISPECIES: hypothetical protein [unclassified Pseudomonas]PVZ09804.1 hypothetical protein F474_04377 [Pseudomonas sp. URIL14HWK12:I12]PVZ21440.1 hypothetical protein F470_04235 [Pseudomonas sp. URIL14HWK12:I10]PVZ30379.1 hypothetical protein F472_04380 [Pseudomonas sp. URIL14HWK12:I11]SNZ18676.1 hypothetical protein SAMN05660463_04254 [Pseudomonas sp. URIL14HWK12:I9]